MIYDNTGRWIEGEELQKLTLLTFSERLRWVREELNKIYVGQYSVKRVSNDSNTISHTGLYKLESSDTLPRQSTLEALAAYYQVPVEIFTAHTPKRFFLGRHYEERDIRSAQYEIEIKYTIRSPIANDPSVERTLHLKARHLDAEELLLRLENEIELTKKRIERQNKLDKAYDLLKGVDSTHD
ncbi:helix-turn-helix transcriptional regulator [Paenibacillus sp. FSL R7-0652]|uniref:helix-turn-helix transcriptional regulator n=1 Tax=Paenibacillus sp. FSL R7-0652 TaxID=2921687 RepID=UPI003159C32B